MDNHLLAHAENTTTSGTVLCQAMMGGWGMMGGTDGSVWGWSMMITGWIFWILILVALVLFIIWLVKQISKK